MEEKRRDQRVSRMLRCWVFAAGVAGFTGSREDVGQGFWRCSDLLSEKTLATFVEGEGKEVKWRAG